MPTSASKRPARAAPVQAGRRAALLALPGLLALRSAAASDGTDATALLSVSGKSLAGSRSGKVDFDMAKLARMAQHRIVTNTPWFSAPREFTGPLLRDVLAAAGLPATVGGQARCAALNDYRVDIPLEDIRRYDIIVARLLDAKPMTVREKGPLFVMYPFDQQPELRTSLNLARCIWQLCGIEVV